MLKKVTLHLITALIIATPALAKQKISKEAHQQAVQLQQQGWILHTGTNNNGKGGNSTTSLEQLLDISINHHNQINPTTNLPKYIIVNSTAKATSFDKAYKMALLKARKDIITLQNSNLNNTSQTDITTTNTSGKGGTSTTTKQRTISSTHLQTKASTPKDNIILCAYRTTSSTTEVMIILEADASE